MSDRTDDPADDPTEPPPWAGAPGFHPAAADEEPEDEQPRPGYQRVGHLPAHAPMPGAPPYPAAEAVEPVVPRDARRRRWWRRR